MSKIDKRILYETLYKAFYPQSIVAFATTNGYRMCVNDPQMVDYRNTFKLTATYNKEKGKLNHPDWYKRLMKYVVEIRSLALNPIQKIPSPIVSVLFKKIDPKGIVECRPICKFKLKWKICLSLYNGIITRLLDEYFLPCSYAFRPPKSGDRYMFQHMNSICQIVDYRKKHIDRILFVAE